MKTLAFIAIALVTFTPEFASADLSEDQAQCQQSWLHRNWAVVATRCDSVAANDTVTQGTGAKLDVDSARRNGNEINPIKVYEAWTDLYLGSLFSARVAYAYHMLHKHEDATGNLALAILSAQRSLDYADEQSLAKTNHLLDLLKGNFFSRKPNDLSLLD